MFPLFFFIHLWYNFFCNYKFLIYPFSVKKTLIIGFSPLYRT